MTLKAARNLVRRLIASNAAALAMRPAGSEVAGLAYAVVLTSRGYEGLPAEMVAEIAEAAAGRYIRQWLGC